jgi:predicted TIM-barrel fold metal-dependent hydrolase
VLAACDRSHPRNNEFVARLAQADPDRFVMFSEIPLGAHRRDELLRRTLQEWPAAGFRYFVPKNELPSRWLNSALERFWEQANAAALCVALNLSPIQAAELGSLVRRCPRIKWLLDHMGRPRFDMPLAEYQPVLDLAAFPNVFVKISGFYAFTARSAAYPYADLACFVKLLKQHFGSNRMLWGSDAPPVLDYSSYEQSFACLSDQDLGFSKPEMKNVFGANACRLFG